MSVGPKRNVMKDLKEAFKAKDPEFHFGLYYSLFEWYNPLYLNDKKANYQTRLVIITLLVIKKLSNINSWSKTDIKI